MKIFKEVNFFMLLKKIPDDPQTRFYISYCSYCGKPYFRTHNRNTLCSYKCKVKSKQDSDAKYSRKRRKQISDGSLIVRDKQQLGTSTVLLSKHVKDDFDQEHLAILKEKRRVGIISQ